MRTARTPASASRRDGPWEWAPIDQSHPSVILRHVSVRRQRFPRVRAHHPRLFLDVLRAQRAALFCLKTKHLPPPLDLSTLSRSGSRSGRMASTLHRSPPTRRGLPMSPSGAEHQLLLGLLALQFRLVTREQLLAAAT